MDGYLNMWLYADMDGYMWIWVVMFGQMFLNVDMGDYIIDIG